MPQPGYNPWATPIFPDHAAFGTGSPAETSTQPAGLNTFLTGLYNGLENLARRAMGNSQSALDTGTYNPRPALEAALMPMGTGAIAGVPVKGAETVMGAGLIRGVKAVPKDLPDLPDVGPIRAYHGSPHDFDRFDLSKIGSGEGAQSYGHGLYFAGNEGVARSYRDILAPHQANAAVSNAQKQLSDLQLSMVDEARRRGLPVKGGGAWGDLDAEVPHSIRTEFAPRLAEAEARVKAAQAADKTGHMYEVNLNADPAHFLDWDKPLAQQSQQIQDALKGITPPHQRGQNAVAAAGVIGPEYGPAAASKNLLDRGIPGIKYLDQGSRPIENLDILKEALAEAKRIGNVESAKSLQQVIDAQSKQTSNYVMFDDKLIDILRKYGIAGMTAPPIFAGAMSEQKQ